MSMHAKAALVCAGLFAVCGQISVRAASADTVVNVSLWDKGMGTEMPTNMEFGKAADPKSAPLGIRVDRSTAKPGKVIFRVKNMSKDMTHEMIVARASNPNKPLPYVANESRVDEEAAKDLGEVSELDPGKSGELALDLEPGAYVLFCNVPAHMAAGMSAVLTVKN